MSELKRFYVEKFEGNVLREFYPEGALKSEVEVKEGKRHGRYREYYEDGTLKLRGSMQIINRRVHGSTIPRMENLSAKKSSRLRQQKLI